ncbi:MAG: SsrA-binding protein SmpB [Deltaproteobacteria bacterium]|nr:SsrA-binding protein SmpB [Deltaproteobacteria bacterium]
MTKPTGIKIVCTNRQAPFHYHLEDSLEAGMVLLGSEVKSLRQGDVQLKDSYVMVRNDEAFLLNCHIGAYKAANQFNHDPTRTRKLLLHRHEISKLYGKAQIKGYTLVPLKIYFKEGKAKIEIALGKSKKKGDKRESIRKKELDREAARSMKRDHRY